MTNKLTRDFFNRPTLEVAKDIIGKIIVHESPSGVTSGRIVEVEAYIGPGDKASHAFNNLRTKRTEIQFGQGGYAYIYFIYGMYNCFNIVTEDSNKPGVLLVRAIEPIDGLTLMCKRRNRDTQGQNLKKLSDLCNGPGKLCTAMGITKELYGCDLIYGPLYIIDNGQNSKSMKLAVTPRINIDYAEEDKHLLWRFVDADSDFISMKKFTKEFIKSHLNVM